MSEFRIGDVVFVYPEYDERHWESQGTICDEVRGSYWVRVVGDCVRVDPSEMLSRDDYERLIRRAAYACS